MSGDVLLIIDGQVNDTAHFKSHAEKQKIIKQFYDVRAKMEVEHPYSQIKIEITETNNEANLSA